MFSEKISIRFILSPGRRTGSNQHFPCAVTPDLHQTDNSHGTDLDSDTHRQLATRCIPAVSCHCHKQYARCQFNYLFSSNGLESEISRKKWRKNGLDMKFISSCQIHAISGPTVSFPKIHKFLYPGH